MNDSSITHHSHHYFIGKRLKKQDAMKIREIQQDIQNKNEFIDTQDKINNVYSPYLYLGYFNENIENKLKHLLVPQLFALAEKFAPMRCPLKNYSLNGQSRRYKYLALTYESPNNYLEDIIIPYLKKYLDEITGTEVVYENVPMVPLFRLKNKLIEEFIRKNPHTKNDGKTIFTDIKMPQVSFNRNTKQKYIDIDSLDLLRATPVTVKKGKKSFNEALHIDSILSIPLSGTL